jgi:hypothetical protein
MENKRKLHRRRNTNLTPIHGKRNSLGLHQLPHRKQGCEHSATHRRGGSVPLPPASYFLAQRTVIEVACERGQVHGRLRDAMHHCSLRAQQGNIAFRRNGPDHDFRYRGRRDEVPFGRRWNEIARPRTSELNARWQLPRSSARATSHIQRGIALSWLRRRLTPPHLER